MGDLPSESAVTAAGIMEDYSPNPHLGPANSVKLPEVMMSCRKDGQEPSVVSDKAQARPPRSETLSLSPPPARDPDEADASAMRGPVAGPAVEEAAKAGAGRPIECIDGNKTSWTSSSDENKAADHRPSLPNTVTSASHLASEQGAATASSGSSSNDNGRGVDTDTDGKGKDKAARATSTQPVREWSTLSSASPSPHTTTRLSFLDKVIAAPDASPAIAISPYGSSHPLYLEAKKYRLQVNRPQRRPPSPPPTKPHSSAPSEPVVPSTSTDTSVLSRASKDPEQEEQEIEKPKSLAQQQEELSVQEKEEAVGTVVFRAPSLSRLSPIETTASSSDINTTEVEMGSRPAYTRSQVRIARRPSPLDMPAAKRRRSNDGGIHVVKVEEQEDETTFLISSKEPSRETPVCPNYTKAGTIRSPDLKDSSSRLPSPSASSIATARRRAPSPSSSVDLRSTVGDEDCSCFENELHLPKIRVPLRLPRPALAQELDLSILELDPSLDGVPLPYILDNIALRGPVLLSSVVESSIALPSTSHLAYSPNSGPAVPTSVAVRTPTRLAQDSALPEYALAVSSDDSTKIMFLPVHGLVLATSCRSFAAIARPPPMELQSVEEGEDTIRVLPVVHIHLPSSIAFSKLVPFFYTREAGSLLSSLLPVQHLPPVSLTAAQKSPALLASHLAKVDQSVLVQSLHFNHNVWRTAVALGAGRDELWKVLQGAWNAIVAALSIQHKALLGPVKTEESEIDA